MTDADAMQLRAELRAADSPDGAGFGDRSMLQRHYARRTAEDRGPRAAAGDQFRLVGFIDQHRHRVESSDRPQSGGINRYRPP